MDLLLLIFKLTILLYKFKIISLKEFKIEL